MSLSNLLRLSLVMAICLLWASLGQAQKKTHTDHKPQYRPWQDDYILDKIEYTADRTIFHFRFVCKPGKFTSLIFYPPSNYTAWYLRDKNTDTSFVLKDLRNVRRNGVLMMEQVKNELSLPALADSISIFSCEIHFERLPDNITMVDLIEGLGQEQNRNHFNCFEVNIKSGDAPDLGREEDSRAVIQAFEQGNPPSTKPSKQKSKKRNRSKTSKDPR